MNADIGVTGLAVMGTSLARNLARHGYSVALHNRTAARTDKLIAEHGDEGTFLPAYNLPDFVVSLARPRKILVMVQAGEPTDAVINKLVPLLEPGDVVVDGGNAHFTDTRRREATLREYGLHFVGAGVSGGEEGALHGPSIMFGGSTEAYALLGPVLENIAAKVDNTPCCAYIGPDGAGHFVKMVHNGIEYADMQLIAEAYDLLRHAGGLTPAQLAEVFRQWNSGDLESFLIEITARVLDHVDARTGQPFVDVVRDQAEQKGTGQWTVRAGLDLGIPVTGIAEAVFARSLSANTRQRSAAAELPGPPGGGAAVPASLAAVSKSLVDDVRRALYASKVVAYAQGFDMVTAANAEYGWQVDLGTLATIWRGGCIIRARFLNRVREAYSTAAGEAGPQANAGGPQANAGGPQATVAEGVGGQREGLPSLLLDPYFRSAISAAQEPWRQAVATATSLGIPVPGFSSALAYYDALRRGRLPAALIQGLRDLFGAHTYQRVDTEGSFHTLWSGDQSEVPA